MKLLNSNFSRARGNTIMLVLVMTGLVGFLLATYLTLVRTQNTATVRSQAWNAAIPLIEAGVEDALTHLNTHGTTNLGCDGWQLLNGQYVIQRYLGDNFYIVGISNWSAGVSNTAIPTITSQGYVTLPMLASAHSEVVMASATSVNPTEGFLGRGVRVTARRDTLFAKGMVAKGQIDLNGNNISSDSFDSADPNASTAGQYDITKRKDNGHIATNSGLTNSLNVGNADVYGKVSTGPGGSIKIGSNGSVGSLAFHAGGNAGIQSGWSTDDMNVDFPDVDPPFSGGAWGPSPGSVDGTLYDYVLFGGNFQMSSLTMSGNKKMRVTGPSVLYVTGNVDISGNAFIEISPGASLKVYVSGPSASLGGNGIINNAGNATNFVYYGMPGNTSLDFTGNGTFTGIVYAPNAVFTLNGGGSAAEDFSGASITKTVKMNGHFKFHYDEALQNYGPPRGFIVNSWNEMTPVTLTGLEALIGLNVQ